MIILIEVLTWIVADGCQGWDLSCSRSVTKSASNKHFQLTSSSELNKNVDCSLLSLFYTDWFYIPCSFRTIYNTNIIHLKYINQYMDKSKQNKREIQITQLEYSSKLTSHHIKPVSNLADYLNTATNQSIKIWQHINHQNTPINHYWPLLTNVWSVHLCVQVM